MVSVSATSSENRTVDVYFGLIGPDGIIYTQPGLTATLSPWLVGFALPAGYTLPQTVFFDAATVPGGLTAGIWQAAIALADAGTQNFFALDMAPFQVVGSTDSADGVTYGFLALDHQGDSGTATASAMFGSYNGSLGNIYEFVENFDSQEANLGQCVLNEFSFDDIGDIPEIQFVSLDAGNPLIVALGGSSQALIKEQQVVLGTTITSYDVDLNNGFYQTGTVTFQGPGGPDVAPFSAAVSVPAPLTLTVPGALVTSHSSAIDLNMEWTGADGTGEVLVTLSATDASFNKTVEIICRFNDDGNATIPASMISAMRDQLSSESTGGGSINIPGIGEIEIPGIDDIPGAGSSLIASLLVQRSSYSVFNTSNNGLDFGVATATSDATRSLTLQ